METKTKKITKQKIKNTAVKAATVLACAASCMAQVGFCDTTPAAVVNSLVDQIIGMMGLVGIVVVVIGVAKFALAMKDENPDGQTRAVYYAIAGAILIGIGPIINALNIRPTT
jgi:putative heme iron utilization protein